MLIPTALRRLKGPLLWAAPLLAGGALALWAYDNDNTARTMQAGPHRTINRLALDRFQAAARADALLGRCDFAGGSKLVGTAVTSPGLEIVLQNDKAGGFRWWVEEGGYSADEPELYASFRHFYDPSATNGATYLTDHLRDFEKLYRAALGRLGRLALGQTLNPQIDAKEWALRGPANQGFGENPYSWNKGIEYLRQAFESSGKDKDCLFAAAWRALGETMHLLADMTSVPHVRNDSHPGKSVGGWLMDKVVWDLGLTLTPDEGYYKTDPYETLLRERVILDTAGGGVDPAVAGAIARAGNPDALFDAVARYTQARFFSSDTVAGTDRHGRAIAPANGLRPFAAPVLTPGMYDPRSGYYVSTVNGRPVRMLHETWIGANGWGSPARAYAISLACARDQASVLIPVAIAANARLLELFVPRVEIKLASYDAGTKILKGGVFHRPSGAHTAALHYNSAPNQVFQLWVDGYIQDWNKVKVEVRNGLLVADLKGLNLANPKRFQISLDIGGIGMRSAELNVQPPAPPPPPVRSYSSRRY